MMARVPASDRIRKRIADVLSGDFDKSELLRNAVRLIVEEALEAEVTEALGRRYYEHGESAGYHSGNRVSVHCDYATAILGTTNSLTYQGWSLSKLLIFGTPKQIG